MIDGARTGPAFQPIIVGGDIGGYSVARAFHAGFGVTSVILAGALTGPVRDSRIAQVRVVKGLEDDEVLAEAVAREIAAAGDAKAIVMGAADWHVEAIVRLRDRWPDAIVPYVDGPTLARATDKVAFGLACEEQGVPYPQTIVIAEGSEAIPADLPYPVVIKAASTSAFHAVSYPGKKKVFYASDAGEAGAIVRDARAGGYGEPFLVQRLVRGGDDHMRVATCFVTDAGEMRDPVVAQVLLEEHTPGALGNPAVISVGEYPDIVDGMRLLVKALGWRGHANFDVKWDADRGEHVFFELNPRLGRSNFYQLAAGVNPTLALVEEHLGLQGENPRGRKRIYSILPAPLVWWYVSDSRLRSRVLRWWLTASFAHPLWYSKDRSVRRFAYVQAAKLNHYRKFARYYRRPVS